MEMDAMVVVVVVLVVVAAVAMVMVMLDDMLGHWRWSIIVCAFLPFEIQNIGS